MQVSEKNPYPTDAHRWGAVVGRDANADEKFYYSVATTGVYCRPSCAARLANRENVRFHASCADAEAAGFRPCKRCKPDQQSLRHTQMQAVDRACRILDAAEEMPKLEELAEMVGISPWHFHRLFKKLTGVTPKAYGDMRKAERLKDSLAEGESVTAALYDAGYSAPSRMYEASTPRLGMTPGQYRNGGKGEQIRFALGECQLGTVLVAASDKGICAIDLGEEPDQLLTRLQDRFDKAELVPGDDGFNRWVAHVVGFLDQPEKGLDLPLDIRGTAFQQQVWQALRTIPLGSKISYAELAEKIGRPSASRAVAQACASNRLAVAIPCHRVVRQDGDLSGYRWGVERKAQLLTREANA